MPPTKYTRRNTPPTDIGGRVDALFKLQKEPREEVMRLQHPKNRSEVIDATYTPVRYHFRWGNMGELTFNLINALTKEIE